MNIILIDNYDSFTYNLLHYLNELDCEVVVKRNDEVSLDEIASFDRIVLSPGPGIPEESGLLKSIIKHYANKKPILGVCLGLQAIVEVFGGEIYNLETVYHGVASDIKVIDKTEELFFGLNAPLPVGRYHSWVAVKDNLPENLIITSLDENNLIMSIKHKTLPIKGVQFHPESILTPDGKMMLKNWLEIPYEKI